MKRKSSGVGPKIVKTSISLPDMLLAFGERRCVEDGFNSFSAYVAQLIRQDKERHEEREAGLFQKRVVVATQERRRIKAKAA